MNLSKAIKMTVVSAATAAGTTAVDSNILDMATFEGVLFIAVLGTVTAGSVLALAVQQNSTNATGGMTAITGASAGLTDSGGASSNGAIMVDVFRPQKQFVRAELTRGTANAAVNAIIAIQYGPGRKPTVQDVTTILASAFAVGS